MADLLFELGVEEIPAQAVSGIRDQLKDLFVARLAQLGIGYGEIECAASNRRLMIHVTKLPEKTGNLLRFTFPHNTIINKHCSKTFANRFVSKHCNCR